MAKAQDRWDAIAASAPLDATAGRVTAKGTHYDPKINFGSTKHWEAPPPMKPVPDDPSCENLVGRKVGKLTVVGLADTKKGNGSPGGAWVVRCVCGDYEHRRRRSIVNPLNVDDACQKCWDWKRKKWRYDNLGSKPICEFIETNK